MLCEQQLFCLSADGPGMSCNLRCCWGLFVAAPRFRLHLLFMPHVCVMVCGEQTGMCPSSCARSLLPLLLFLIISNTNMCESKEEGDGQKHKTVRSPNLCHVGETSNWELHVPQNSDAGRPRPLRPDE